MKVRNILIGLMVVLMAFVFISCEDEPEPQPQPVKVDDTVYKLTATKGISDAVFSHDKFSIWFKEAVEPGATISMEFRSTADYFQMNVRGIGGSPKYVYEEDIKTDGSNTFKLEPLSDGWTKFSYTFADDAADSEDFRVDFRGWIIPGDVMELRHVFYDGQQIALSEENMSGTDYAAPTIEVVADHEWTTPKTYKVAYFIGKPDDVDKNPVVETVAAGGTVTKAALVKENSEIAHIYNYDKSGTQGEEFNEATAINADTFLLVVWKGVDRTVTFHLNYEDAEELGPVIVENGTTVEAPDINRPNYKLLGWTYEADDDELEGEFDLSTPVTANLDLYAQWANAVDVTLYANYVGADPASTTVSAGLGVAMDEPDAPERDGWFFDKWTLDAAGTEDYDFSEAVTEEFDLYAQWTEAVTLTLNANYGDTPATKDIVIKKGTAPTADMAQIFSGKPGSSISKWTTGSVDAVGDEDDYAFTSVVNADTTIYAQWTEGSVVKMTAAGIGGSDGESGNSVSDWEKIQLNWDLRTELSDSNAGITEGSVLSFQFRSERGIYAFDVRNNKKSIKKSDSSSDTSHDVRWVYQGNGDTAHFVVTPAEDGWYNVVYTFGTTGTKAPNYASYQYYNLGLNFQAYYVEDDVFEIKGVAFNGKPLSVVSSTIKKGATFVGTPDGPDSIPNTCAVIFIGHDQSDVGYGEEQYPIMTKVTSGSTVSAPTVGGSTLTFFSDAARTEAFDFATPITEDTKVFYVKTTP